MAARVAASLALVAALLIIGGEVTGRWWSGNLRMDGHVIEGKVAHLGLWGGVGCATKGTRGCQSWRHFDGPSTMFAVTGAATSASGLVAAASLLLVAYLMRKGRRSDEATLLRRAWLVAVVACGSAVALALLFVVSKPASADLPVGYSLVMYFAGAMGGAGVGAMAGLRRARAAAVAASAGVAAMPAAVAPSYGTPLAEGSARGSDGPPRPLTGFASLAPPAEPMMPTLPTVIGRSVEAMEPASASPPTIISASPPAPVRVKAPSIPPPIPSPALRQANPSRPPPAPPPRPARISKPPPMPPAKGEPSPACPSCDAPTRWSDEHLRFYCVSCRLYL